MLVGPADKTNFPHASFGKIMHDAIKEKNRNDVVLIDGFSRAETTYGEILDVTRQLAAGLIQLGIGLGDTVALINDNTVQYCVPVLATLYTGATINPLNPVYSKRELQHAFNIAKPKAIFCSELVLKTVLALKNEIPSLEHIIVIGAGIERETLDMEDIIKRGQDTVNDFEPVAVDCEKDIAAILCSSGTTGLPKGVLLSHENLRTPLTYLNTEEFCCVAKEDTLIGVAPCFHILGLLINLSTLAFGAKLILMEKFKPDVFLKLIEDYRVNRLIIVPSLAVFLAKSPMVENYDMTSIKDVMCGAAGLGKDVQTILEERFNVSVRQCYGLTEATGGVTMGTRVAPVPNSIGRMLPQVLLRIVDPDTHEVRGPHERGELRVRGPNVMRGYCNNEQASADAMDAEGWLCTGDIGYYDEEGNVFVVDRLKELIKYKGFQVPPAELEDILLSNESIKDCGVIGIPDERSGELPLAYVVRQPNAQITEQEIIDYVADLVSIQKRLYGGVRFVEEIPKNPSGKILRRILREMYEAEQKKS